MSEVLSVHHSTMQANGIKALKKTVIFWFLITAAGQLIFLSYIVAFYGGAAVQGDMEAWNLNMATGFTAGDTIGNLAAASHLLFAVIIIGGGIAQFIPQIRSRYPVVHRWIGKIYMVTLISTSIVGLAMLSNSFIGGFYMRIGFVLQAMFIIYFSFKAFQHAKRREFRVHSEWAFRLFLVASAVWFFRVMLMIWIMLTGGLGVDLQTGQGPFIEAMSFFQYLPLVIYEIYLRIVRQSRPVLNYSMAAFLIIATLATGLGVSLATMGMWFPVE